MSEQELTPWFPANVKPAHDGVYQFLDDWYAVWANGCWYLSSGSIVGATNNFNNDEKSDYSPEDRIGDGWQWRGLAKEPK